MPGEVPSDVPSAAFGRFHVLHQIGAGGLGPVFRGEDPETHEPVVIRELRLGLPPDVARRISNDLLKLIGRVPQHPRLARVIGAGVVSNVDPYVVTTLSAGDSLDAALAKYGPAAIVDAVPRLRDLADALDRAAQYGVWHGALQPSDITVSAEETQLSGVGIAPVLERAGVLRPTRGAYTAPEVMEGHSSTPASDQYALATITYEWLFGRVPPVPTESPLIVPALPDVDGGALANGLNTARAWNPADRFPSCADFVASMEKALSDRMQRAAGTVERTAESKTPVILPLSFGSDEPAAPTATTSEDRSFEVAPAGLPVSAFPFQSESEQEITEKAPDERASPDLPPQEPRRQERALHEHGPAEHALPEHPSQEFAPPEHGALLELAPAAVASDGAGETDLSASWQGRLAAESAQEAAPRHRSRFGGGFLVAVLIAGMALGAAGAYLFDTVRAPQGEQPSSPLTADQTPDVPPPSATGRDYTDTPLEALPKPDNVPDDEPKVATAPPPRTPAPEPDADVAPATTASLLVRSTPSGASVTVDGTARGVTPLPLRNLELGTRAVVVSRPGFASVERRVTLTADRPSRSMDVALTRATDATGTPSSSPPTGAADAPLRRSEGRPERTATTGSLEIDSRPRGASVTIDGRSAGTTPLTVATLAPGGYVVRIELAGYQSVMTTVQVRAGERSRVAATLEGGQGQE